MNSQQVDADYLIRTGKREVPVFSRGGANEDCESGHPPRRPHRHCQEQAVSMVRVCVVGYIFADAACECMLCDMHSQMQNGSGDCR